MAEPLAEVRNAADPEQVKRAARREKSRESRREDITRAVLATQAGRAMFWYLLTNAGVFRSVFDRDAGLMAFNAGRQDFGHELMADLIAADPAAYELMEREARALAKQDRATTEAAHTARLDDGVTKERTT